MNILSYAIMTAMPFMPESEPKPVRPAPPVQTAIRFNGLSARNLRQLKKKRMKKKLLNDINRDFKNKNGSWR